MDATWSVPEMNETQSIREREAVQTHPETDEVQTTPETDEAQRNPETDKIQTVPVPSDSQEASPKAPRKRLAYKALRCRVGPCPPLAPKPPRRTPGKRRDRRRVRAVFQLLREECKRYVVEEKREICKCLAPEIDKRVERIVRKIGRRLDKQARAQLAAYQKACQLEYGERAAALEADYERRVGLMRSQRDIAWMQLQTVQPELWYQFEEGYQYGLEEGREVGEDAGRAEWRAFRAGWLASQHIPDLGLSGSMPGSWID